jgi:hypothetical protein
MPPAITAFNPLAELELLFYGVLDAGGVAGYGSGFV